MCCLGQGLPKFLDLSVLIYKIGQSEMKQFLVYGQLIAQSLKSADAQEGGAQWH